jgi:hypothetical protein
VIIISSFSDGSSGLLTELGMLLDYFNALTNKLQNPFQRKKEEKEKEKTALLQYIGLPSP